MTQRIIKSPDDFHPIPGLEGLYEINLAGQVRSLPRIVVSRGGTRSTGRRLLKGRLLNGYPSFSVRVEGINRQMSVHRALATIFIANPDNKPHINHLDGNKANFALSNLEWCTHQENMRHAFDSGLTPRPKSGPGEMSPAARLNWNDVEAIRSLAVQGVSRAAIAERFGVSKSNVSQIVRGETWREVPL